MVFFRLIRWPNLVIVLLTQYLIYHRLFYVNYQTLNMEPKLAPATFWLLAISTLLITAGGNIINDIIDQKVDAINKPQKRIVGKTISSQIATWLYVLMCMIGFFIFIIICMQEGFMHFFFIYPSIIFLLVFYSYFLKKVPLAGNILIALLCAAVPGLIWLFESSAFLLIAENAPLLSRRISAVLLWYMSFAFLGTLYREIIKDMEDREGDAKVGCQTIAVKWGLGTAKILAFIVGGLLFTLLLVQFLYLGNFFSRSLMIFALLGVLIPLAISFQRLASAKTQKQYWIISQLIKLILLNGVLLLFFL